MNKKLRMAGASAAAALVLALVVPVGSASAGDCGWYSRTVGDYSARVDKMGDCSYIGVRHYYDPVWSANNYWTAWKGGAGSSYTTANNPVVVFHEATGY